MVTPFSVLKTDRLTLRQLASSDDEAIFALRTDEKVNKYLDRVPSKSMNDAQTFIWMINEGIQNRNLKYWALTLSGNDELIGTICLFNFAADNKKAEIGYELLPDFQGKGIMQEAVSKIIDFGFQSLGLEVIEAHTQAQNQSSTRLLEKCKFKVHENGNDNFVIFKLTRTG